MKDVLFEVLAGQSVSMLFYATECAIRQNPELLKNWLRRLVEHEGATADSSILSLSEISKAHPQVQGLQDRIAELETAVKALEALSGYRIAKPVGAELK
jgi:hypothetical protein